MECWVYILISATTGKLYCGQTSDLGRRVDQHNDQHHTYTKTTKHFAGPWKLLWSTSCPDRGEAIRLERKIKARGVKRYLEDLRQLSSNGC